VRPRIQLTETMRGQHHFVDPALGEPTDRPFSFRLVWGAELPVAMNPLDSRFMVFDATGTIDVDGLTDGGVPCEGTLRVDYLRERSIAYELDFALGDRRYRYSGKKVGIDLLRPIELVKTHTTCYGAIARDDGRVVSKSVAHFEPDELLPFLMSFRVALA